MHSMAKQSSIACLEAVAASWSSLRLLGSTAVVTLHAIKRCCWRHSQASCRAVVELRRLHRRSEAPAA